jgi:hypothetical protein
LKYFNEPDYDYTNTDAEWFITKHTPDMKSTVPLNTQAIFDKFGGNCFISTYNLYKEFQITSSNVSLDSFIYWASKKVMNTRLHTCIRDGKIAKVLRSKFSRLPVALMDSMYNAFNNM